MGIIALDQYEGKIFGASVERRASTSAVMGEAAARLPGSSRCWSQRRRRLASRRAIRCSRCWRRSRLRGRARAATCSLVSGKAEDSGPVRMDRIMPLARQVCAGAQVRRQQRGSGGARRGRRSGPWAETGAGPASGSAGQAAVTAATARIQGRAEWRPRSPALFHRQHRQSASERQYGERKQQWAEVARSGQPPSQSRPDQHRRGIR